MAIYIIKANIVLMLLYGFYRLMCNRDTFFIFRRVTLWCIYITALIVPALNFEYYIQQTPITVSMAHAYAINVIPSMTVFPASFSSADYLSFTWMEAIKTVYFLGVVLMLLRFVNQIISLLYVLFTTKVMIIDGIKIHVIKNDDSPFSFFGFIFVNPYVQTKQLLSEIIIHEKAHIQQLHNIDVVFSEIITILFWFNPFAWLMKREVRINLEYLADKSVIDSGNDRKSYQYHLLGLTYKNISSSLSNNFNVMPLKKRIKMMNKNRSKNFLKAKYLLFIPLIASLFLVSNIEAVARMIANKMPVVKVIAAKTETVLNTTAMKVPVSPVNSAMALQKRTSAEKNQSYKQIVDTATVKEKQSSEVLQPRQSNIIDDNEYSKTYTNLSSLFSGGSKAMSEYFSSNVKYPTSAIKADVSKHLAVSFMLNEDGKIKNARVFEYKNNGDKNTNQNTIVIVGRAPRTIDKVTDADKKQAEKDINDAAIDLIKGMPALKHGSSSEKIVVPINFIMENKKLEEK